MVCVKCLITPKLTFSGIYSLVKSLVYNLYRILRDCFPTWLIKTNARITHVVLVIKSPPANAGDLRGVGSVLRGEKPMEERWQSTPVFLPEESHGQRSLAGYRPWGCRVGHNWSNLAPMYAHNISSIQSKRFGEMYFTSHLGFRKHHFKQSYWRCAISSPKRWCCESAVLNMPTNLQNSAVATDWKRSVFIPIPKKGNAKECSNCCTTAFISHTSKVMLKILQARLWQYVTWKLPDIQARFRKVRGTRDQIANIHWIPEKENSRKTSASAFIDYVKAFVWIIINWKILEEIGIADHLTCLLRNLYAIQEATARTRHGTTNWFEIGKEIGQGRILSPCLFNSYAEFSCSVVSDSLWPHGLQHDRLPCPSPTPSLVKLMYIMQNVRMDEAQTGIKIATINGNADDTKVMAER